jgi:hypothetical protein
MDQALLHSTLEHYADLQMDSVGFILFKEKAMSFSDVVLESVLGHSTRELYFYIFGIENK